MPNYEIVHDQVGPFPRAVEGSDKPRVVSGESIDATGPEVTKAGPKSPVYEGNLKFWTRVGAIKETEEDVTPEPVPPGVLNNGTVADSPEGKAARAPARREVSDIPPSAKKSQ